MKASTKAHLLCSPLLGVALEIQDSGHVPSSAIDFLMQCGWGYLITLAFLIIAVSLSSFLKTKPLDDDDSYDEMIAHYITGVAAMSLGCIMIYYITQKPGA